MIAIAAPQTIIPAEAAPEPTAVAGEPPAPTWHGRFLVLLPRIRRHAEWCFRNLKSEARADATAEVVAHALVSYAQLFAAGKEDRAYASALAGYAVARFRRGRRVGIRANKRDMTSPYSRLHTGIVIERLHGNECGSGGWRDTVVEDRRSGPDEIAATRIDFNDWLAALPLRNRHIAEKLAVGESTSGVARLFGISPGRVAQLRRELHDAWHSFQGEPVASKL